MKQEVDSSWNLTSSVKEAFTECVGLALLSLFAAHPRAFALDKSSPDSRHW